uniref:Uncharacterized protein n=1 Tax=Siphoviridae sp. ctorp6 TaxID=2825673 RepID=A0A8S5PC98_9CAUD|nr:MAG TPA: hypothetical protein [Siphoviridae sp. ctorp6]
MPRKTWYYDSVEVRGMRRDSLPCASLSPYGLLTRHLRMPAVICR